MHEVSVLLGLDAKMNVVKIIQITMEIHRVPSQIMCALKLVLRCKVLLLFYRSSVFACFPFWGRCSASEIRSN
jgi:hypothetical protein